MHRRLCIAPFGQTRLLPRRKVTQTVKRLGWKPSRCVTACVGSNPMPSIEHVRRDGHELYD